MASVEESCIAGNCNCQLDTLDIFRKAKEIVDLFFEEKIPGTYVKIELRSIDEFGKPCEVRAQVKLYKIEAYGNHKIFDIMAFRIQNCEDLYIFANYLKITIIQWGIQLSDTEEESD